MRIYALDSTRYFSVRSISHPLLRLCSEIFPLELNQSRRMQRASFMIEGRAREARKEHKLTVATVTI